MISFKYKKKGFKPKCYNSREIGVRVVAGGRAIPAAYMMYEDEYDDGTIRIRYGKRVSSMQGYGNVNDDLKSGVLRPDLFPVLHAVRILLDEIENACRHVDTQSSKKGNK